MEVTNEMLDVIEELKGKRKASLWDNRCAQTMADRGKKVVNPVKPAVKTTDKS